MILVCPPDQKSLARVERLISGASLSWTYLGQSLVDAKRAEQLFQDRGTFVDANPGFHLAAEVLREPYLTYIYNIGEELASLRWWIGSVSCRSGVISKSFQQVCNLKVALDLVEKWDGPGDLVLVLEESLLPALAKNLKTTKQKGIRVVKGHRTFPLRRVGDLLRMLAHRTFFLVREGSRVLQARRLVSRPRLNGPPATIIFSWVTSDSIKEGVEFHKTFYGTLIEELEQRGSHVAIVPIIWKELDYSLVLSRLRQMPQPFLVPHRYLGLGDLIRTALATTVRPRLPRQLTSFEGMNIEGVFEADLRHHWISNAAADALLTRDLVRRWAGLEFSIDRFIYVYENQPYERALCWEAQRRFPGAAIVGYQHARAPWMAINMYQAPGGEQTAPQPHLIMTVGTHTARLLTTNGNNPERVKVGGALQMEGFFRFLTESHSVVSDPCPTVLVAASSRLEEAAELVDMAVQLLPEDKGVRFLIKCHPVMPFEAFSALLDRPLPPHVQISDAPIPELITKSSAMIYTSSITCVQALALGVPVVHLRTRFDFDMDPLDSFPDARLEATGLNGLRDQVRWILENRDEYIAEHREQWDRLVEDMYGAVTDETYRAFLEPIQADTAGGQSFAKIR